MSDVLEQAKRLVGWADEEKPRLEAEQSLYELYRYAANEGIRIARALIETQQRLDDARALAQQVLAEHRKRGAALTAACGGDESVRMAREWLASVEAEGSES